MRSAGSCSRLLSTTLRRTCAATIPIGSIRILPPRSATSLSPAPCGDGGAGGGPPLSPGAPLDWRVNMLVSDRDKAAAALAHLYPQPTRWSPWGLRIALASDARNPAVQAEPAFLKGAVEVQD